MTAVKNQTLLKKRSKVFTTYLVVIAAYIVMQTLSSMGMLSRAMEGYLVPICVYIVLAVSLNLVVGISGELSLGHAGFMGVGAFAGVVVSGCLTEVIGTDWLRLIVALMAGGIVAGIAGVVVGIPVLRLRGDYLAIVTLAFGEILKNLAGNLYVGKDSRGVHMAFDPLNIHLEEDGKMLLKGPMGSFGVEKISTFFMGFMLILVTLFVVLNIIHSKEGRAIKAIRDNRIAAESVGINVTAFKLKAFTVSAILAGMAGALFGLNYSSITASQFGYTNSINILVFVVLGGMGNILGSVISASVLYLLPEMLRGLEDYRMILYAVVLIVVMLCTWSPGVKNALNSGADTIRKKLFSKKQEVTGND